MKVLRIWGIEHYDGEDRFIGNNHMERRYKKRPVQRDFSAETPFADAKQVLHDEFGWPPELAETKYAPERFIRIQNHTICDDAPQRGVIEEVRASEQDLFPGADMMRARSTKPQDPRLK